MSERYKTSAWNPGQYPVADAMLGMIGMDSPVAPGAKVATSPAVWEALYQAVKNLRKTTKLPMIGEGLHVPTPQVLKDMERLGENIPSFLNKPIPRGDIAETTIDSIKRIKAGFDKPVPKRFANYDMEEAFMNRLLPGEEKLPLGSRLELSDYWNKKQEVMDRLFQYSVPQPRIIKEADAPVVQAYKYRQPKPYTKRESDAPVINIWEYLAKKPQK